jgi:hypothetical protein
VKKKWDNDGPRRSSQGYGWSWRYLNAILCMSHESGKARADVAMWWKYLNAHPDIKENIRTQLSRVPPEKLIAYMEDMIQRHASETKRRQQILRAEGATL